MEKSEKEIRDEGVDMIRELLFPTGRKTQKERDAILTEFLEKRPGKVTKKNGKK